MGIVFQAKGPFTLGAALVQTTFEVNFEKTLELGHRAVELEKTTPFAGGFPASSLKTTSNSGGGQPGPFGSDPIAEITSRTDGVGRSVGPESHVNVTPLRCPELRALHSESGYMSEFPGVKYGIYIPPLGWHCGCDVRRGIALFRTRLSGKKSRSLHSRKPI